MNNRQTEKKTSKKKKDLKEEERCNTVNSEEQV